MFGYILTASIYLLVGFLGGLACAEEVPAINATPWLFTNFFDCVATHETGTEKFFYVVGKFVQAGILFQNYSVMPVILFLTRK